MAVSYPRPRSISRNTRPTSVLGNIFYCRTKRVAGVSTRGGRYFDDANANAAQLPPQCHLKGMEPGLGRGIGQSPR